MSDDPRLLLTLSAEYASAPLATTDLHAGGIFFCVLYEEVLVFRPNNIVELSVRVIDNWRPFDDEQENLTSMSANGVYGLDGNGFLECDFPNVSFTGLPCKIRSDWLAFHVFDRVTARSKSRVYARRDSLNCAAAY